MMTNPAYAGFAPLSARLQENLPGGKAQKSAATLLSVSLSRVAAKPFGQLTARQSRDLLLIFGRVDVVNALWRGPKGTRLFIYDRKLPAKRGVPKRRSL